MTGYQAQNSISALRTVLRRLSVCAGLHKLHNKPVCAFFRFGRARRNKAEINQLLEWLSRLFGSRSAVESRRENPIFVASVKKSAEIYGRIPLQQFIGSGQRERMARQLYLEISAVCSSTSPVTAVREKMAEAMLRFSLYQVLVIPPPPEEDESELRLLAGISGEMRAHLPALALKNTALRSDLHQSDQYDDSADLWHLVQYEYWKNYWLLESFNATRQELGDVARPSDWFRAYLHSACANQENLYRIDLDFASAFQESIAKSAATAYSIFTDIVISGAPDPIAEWLEYHEGQAIPTPGVVNPEASVFSLRA